MVEGVEVHAPSLRMRARLVEALDAAGPAEEMFRGASAEAVAGQRRFSGEQAEVAMGHDQVTESARRADRAIAVEHLDSRRHLGLEPHRPAMAAAGDAHLVCTLAHAPP